MSSDRFQQHIARTQNRPAQPQLIKDGTPEDDEARPASYEAVRRIRSFSFADVMFRFHTGAVQALPWAYMRGWLCNEDGTRLTMIWPEFVVDLVGSNLDQIEEDLMRRIVAEFRQVKPLEARQQPEGVPVIVELRIDAIEQHGDVVAA